MKKIIQKIISVMIIIMIFSLVPAHGFVADVPTPELDSKGYTSL